MNDNVTYGEIHTWDTSGVDPTWTLQSVYVRQPDVTEFGGLVSFYDWNQTGTLSIPYGNVYIPPLARHYGTDSIAATVCKFVCPTVEAGFHCEGGYAAAGYIIGVSAGTALVNASSSIFGCTGANVGAPCVAAVFSLSFVSALIVTTVLWRIDCLYGAK